MSGRRAPGSVRALQLVRLDLDGDELRVRLAVRTTGETIPDVRGLERRTHEDLVYHVLDAIDVVDGRVPRLADAARICGNPRALRQLLGARNRLWTELQSWGRLRARCPHCRERESSFDLTTLMLVLRHPVELFTRDGAFLEVPSLAEPRPPGLRYAGVPTADLLRLTLPSGAAGLVPRAHEAVLQQLSPEREEAAWERWAPDGVVPPADHAHWFRGSPGFRAILRLAQALRTLDGVDPAGNPEVVEALPVVDFLFLDSAYLLTHHVDQRRPDTLLVECERCGGAYLPLG